LAELALHLPALHGRSLPQEKKEGRRVPVNSSLELVGRLSSCPKTPAVAVMMNAFWVLMKAFWRLLMLGTVEKAA
jgi:hypothetical protein